MKLAAPKEKQTGRKYSDGQMLDELRRVAALVDGLLSRPKYMTAGPMISISAIEKRFGTWLKAMGAAGLESDYRFGGTWFDCPICGARFRSNNGPKSRRTCSKQCSSDLMSRQRSRGADASPQAARGRTKRLIKPTECAECGARGCRLEVHHVDHDPYNNDLTNLRVLCVSCHRRKHPPKNHEKRRRGSANHNSKLSEQDIPVIRRRLAAGETRRAIAADYGVTGELISAVATGRVWRHVS